MPSWQLCQDGLDIVRKIEFLHAVKEMCCAVYDRNRYIACSDFLRPGRLEGLVGSAQDDFNRNPGLAELIQCVAGIGNSICQIIGSRRDVIPFAIAQRISFKLPAGVSLFCGGERFLNIFGYAAQRDDAGQYRRFLSRIGIP
jgi:hypothetical protein